MEAKYGFKVETDNFEYYIRCLPKQGAYDWYCFCYDEAQLAQLYNQ